MDREPTGRTGIAGAGARGNLNESKPLETGTGDEDGERDPGVSVGVALPDPVETEVKLSGRDTAGDMGEIGATETGTSTLRWVRERGSKAS